MTHVALVLGAGGVLGSAFHAGVVAGLHEATGWDARDAELVVGTSAGASTAATLRAGLAPADHLAHATGEPLSAAGEAIAARVRTGLQAGPPAPGRRVRPPASARLVVEGLLGSGPIRPAVSIAGMMPRGTVATSSLEARIREVHPEAWPRTPTWICAVSLRTGRRVVFGRDDVEVGHVGEAVAASSAIPGWFAPVRIGRTDYVDGGVHSTTNADLTSGLGFDLVVVSAPMAQRDPEHRGTPRSRGWHSRVLRRELEEVRRSSATIAVRPGVADLHLFAAGNMDPGSAIEVARLGRRLAVEALTGASRHAGDVLRSAARSSSGSAAGCSPGTTAP